MSTIDFAFGVLIGYFIGVIKEKLRWIEKFISSRRAEKELKENLESEE